MQLVAEPILQAKAVLGEGSIWDPMLQVLYWVDIDKFQLHTFDPATGQDSFVNLGRHVGTVVKRSAGGGGGFIVALPDQFAHVDSVGKITAIADVEKGLGNRMNDGKCDPAGRFWCGSMNFKFLPGAGNLWMLDTDHQVHHKLGNVTCSNGLVWTGDGKRMYYIDTFTRHLDVFDYDVSTGAIENRRIAVENTWTGHFDGMTIDADDNVYIATWAGGAVLKIDPRTGDLLARIEVPGVKNVTSCAFGGAKLNDLYITSSANGADLEEEPNAGALFRIRLADAAGLPAFEFQG
jgi:sugar lactone lactonase YvrE